MNTNTTSASKKTITLEEIAERKIKVRKRLKEQKEILADDVKDLFSPFIPDPNTPPLMRTFNTGLAIYDGVMTGIKVMKRIRKFLHRKR